MSFLWNTLRLHGARALVPKSRLARVGLGTAVAVGAGISYLSWRMERDFASDEFQSDPPLPPELDRKYREARWALDNDMPSEAWFQLVKLLQTYVTPDLDLSDPDKVAILASIGESLVEAGLDAKLQDVDPARLHDIALLILPAILGSGMATTREHLRAVQLAWCLSYTVVEDDCSKPFLQWATMQSLDLSSQLDPVPSTLLDAMGMIMLGNKNPDDLWSCIPVMLATAVRFDSSLVNTDAIQTDLRPLLQLRCASNNFPSRL
ncbi:hypothetical protein EXIGLDRAFT_327494 [Exidia glandulosa HHB12029]|uniref:Uncharacterized protein n=1 Tax=Exidia glandulosa HHB12029 TaxID=1314781 RepID=A0A165LNV0_EXIGL|nr:hypothetical protein EXIGLDRAFT_327494 [Exidia glandulosa HHB12029]